MSHDIEIDHTLPPIEKGAADKLVSGGGIYDPAKLEAAHGAGRLSSLQLEIIAINQRNVTNIGLAAIDHGLDQLRITGMILRVCCFIVTGIILIDAVIRWGTV